MSNVSSVSPARTKISADRVQPTLLADQSTALLQELHLLTKGGDLNADALRKLKQINHLCGFLQPFLEPLFQVQADPGQPTESEEQSDLPPPPAHDPVIVDAGAGNAYLGFILYELWLKNKDIGHVYSVEVRQDLVARSRQRAAALGYARMQFVDQPVAQLAVDAESRQLHLPTGEKLSVDMVVALHACDTATDDALALAITAHAPVIAVVPCCQAELSRQLTGRDLDKLPAAALWRHPIQRREFAAHLTNVMRALVLEAHGYQVTVTELTGWQHSLKNELILAHKVQRRNGAAIAQLNGLLALLPPLQQTLLQRVGLPAAG